MPINYKDYPADWEAISLRIRNERAGGKCETCGVPNGEVIVYPPGKRHEWRLADGGHYEEALCEQGLLKMTKIVLTVAHIGAPKEDGSPGNKHDKMDARDCNLKAECQACHLKRDFNDHATNRKNGRNWRRDQTTLPL